MGQSIDFGTDRRRPAGPPWSLERARQHPRLRLHWRPRYQKAKLVDSLPVFDAATLAALSGDIGPGVFAEILVDFVDDLRDRLDRIANAAATTNLKALAFESHAVSSCSHTFGALRMARICRGIERAVEKGDAQAAVALAGSLSRVAEETLDALADYH